MGNGNQMTIMDEKGILVRLAHLLHFFTLKFRTPFLTSTSTLKSSIAVVFLHTWEKHIPVMYIMYNNVSKNPLLSLVLLRTWYGKSTLGGNTKTVVGDALTSFVVHFVGCNHGKKGPSQAKTNTRWCFHGLFAPWRAFYFILLRWLSQLVREG